MNFTSKRFVGSAAIGVAALAGLSLWHEASSQSSMSGSASRASVWADRVETGAASGNNTQGTVSTVLNAPAVLTRFTMFDSVNAANCTTSPVFGLVDTTKSVTLASVTITNNTSAFDSGALAVGISVGDTIQPTWITASGGCTTQVAGLHFAAALR